MNTTVITERLVFTAQQMQTIESVLFAAGMPIAALMEKVGQRLTERFVSHYPREQCNRVGICVGPGHNGGDGLVVARELYHLGYQVLIWQPFAKAKDLTQAHGQFAQHLGIPFHSSIDPLLGLGGAGQQGADQEGVACDVVIDALFGFGLIRAIAGDLANAIQQLNDSEIPVVSIDIPSGIHTDTGEVLGIAIAAQRTYCLGLWKQGLFCDPALPYVGQAERIEIGIRAADVSAGLGSVNNPQLISRSQVQACLPFNRPVDAHKYRVGSLLLVAGSRRFPGAAFLSAKAASEMGVGMLYVAVPEQLQAWVVAQIPHAVVIPCPETETGAIAQFPMDLDWSRFDAIAFGPGLTLDAAPLLTQVWPLDKPLVLDADGLNALAQKDGPAMLRQRCAPTVLTPHLGEFKRLFPGCQLDEGDRFTNLRQLAVDTHATIVLKGPKTAIASSLGEIWINPDSTPALARGGSGDVLTGVIAGLLAQRGLIQCSPALITASSVWLHAQAGCDASQARTPMGVDPMSLLQNLNSILQSLEVISPNL